MKNLLKKLNDLEQSQDELHIQQWNQMMIGAKELHVVRVAGTIDVWDGNIQLSFGNGDDISYVYKLHAQPYGKNQDKNTILINNHHVIEAPEDIGDYIPKCGSICMVLITLYMLNIDKTFK